MTTQTADPYAGIDLPKPPRGYRLAKWGETCESGALWLLPHSHKWIKYGRTIKESYGLPDVSIFAVPKPRIRIELVQGRKSNE